jgi:hypothetical protein
MSNDTEPGELSPLKDGAQVFPFSTFKNVSDNAPKARALIWRELCELLEKRAFRGSKDGALFSGASYPPGASRGNAGVAFVSLATLDFDDGATLDGIEAGVSSLNNGTGCAAFIYSTHSHNPGAGAFKYRLVLPLLEPVAGVDWPEVWKRLALAFDGAPDEKAKDAARIHYFPSCPRERAGDALALERTGAPLDVSSLPELPKEAPRADHAARAASGDAYARKVFDAEIGKLCSTGAGRNDALNRCAFRLGQFTGANRLNRSEVESALLDAAHANGYAAKDGESAARSTIQSGLNRGELEPERDGLPARATATASVSTGARPLAPQSGNDSTGNNPAPEGEAGEVGAPRFQFQTLAQLRQQPAPQWLIHRLLVRGGTSLLTAKHASFKSFFALDMALCVATGTPWQGFEVARGPVIYVAAEGAHGLRKRADAWEAHHAREAGENFTVLDVPLRIHETGTRAAFVAEIAALAPVFIVLDTLARCAVGLDENNSGDMGIFSDALGDLARATGAHVLTVHHNNKAGDYRGSSALPAAVDTHLSLERNRDAETPTATLKTEKQKDFEELEPLTFEAREIAIPGARGEAHSLVFERLENTNGSQWRLGSIDQKALDELAGAFGEAGATSTQWWNVCEGAGISKRAFYYAKTRLLEFNAVSCSEPAKRGAVFVPSADWCKGAKLVQMHLCTNEGAKVQIGALPTGECTNAPLHLAPSMVGDVLHLAPKEPEAETEAAGVDEF